MNYFATIDGDGRATGFYLQEIHGGAMPADAFPISADIHAAWITDTSRQMWDGTTLQPCDPPPPPPPAPIVAVTMRQARLALLDAGLLDDVDAAVAAAPRAVQIEWEYSTRIERASPLLAAIAAGLSLDDATLDALFEDASRR